MRKALVISPDKAFLKEFGWTLEQAGYAVSFSGSLEEAFCEVNQPERSLILVDSTAVANPLWEAERFVRWFHRRSKVLVLCGDSTVPPCEHDLCLPKSIEKSKLLARIEDLR